MAKVTFCAKNNVNTYPITRKAANGISYLNAPTKHVESDFRYGIKRCKQALHPLNIIVKGVDLAMAIVKVGYHATKKILF